MRVTQVVLAQEPIRDQESDLLFRVFQYLPENTSPREQA